LIDKQEKSVKQMNNKDNNM